jgi:hypothetical protein
MGYFKKLSLTQKLVIEPTNITSFNKNKSWFNDKAANGYLEKRLSAGLNQAHVLQALTHFVTVRGDAFNVTYEVIV